MASFAGILGPGAEGLSVGAQELFFRIACSGNGRSTRAERGARYVFVRHDVPICEHGADGFVASACLEDGADIAPGTRFDWQTDPENYVRSTFESQGDRGVAQLRGKFAFAHWSERQQTLTLARDCFGAHALFYHVGSNAVIFASHLSTLLAHPDVPRELDERLLANFLALNHREREQTPYRGILRVPSRTIVRITRSGVSQRHYWSPSLAAAEGCKTDQDYIARARELFDRAVARITRDTPRIAIKLSGGLDSSAVAATAIRQGRVDITCYTGLPPPDLGRPPRPGWYLSERDKVEALIRLHPSLLVKFVTPRASQFDPTRLFYKVPLPIRGPSHTDWFSQIKDVQVADGYRVFSGGGGGNFTLSWYGSFSLCVLLQQGRLGTLAAEATAIGRLTERSLSRVLLGEALFPLLPPLWQRAIGRLRGLAVDDVGDFSLLRKEIVDELDLQRQWRDDGFDSTYRFRGTSASYRCHLMFDQNQLARDYGAMFRERSDWETRSPFLDRDVIEFSLSVPETLYRKNGIKRWFARQVFADRLPPEILNETRSGEQAPNWFELLEARKPNIVDAVERLEGSRLANRLIDIPRLKRLISEWPKDASAAEPRRYEYRNALDRAVHVGQFISWVEGGNG